LSEYKTILAWLHCTLSSLNPSLPSAETLAEIEHLKYKLATSGQGHYPAPERINALEQQLFELNREIAGGQHIPATPVPYRLTAHRNSEQQCFDLQQSTMDRDKLNAENMALRRRLHDLESSLASSDE
jgi:hypothetical protein